MDQNIKRAVRKAAQSPCRYKVGCIAYSRRGEILGFTSNLPNIKNKGGGVHAEEAAIRIWGRGIKSLLIVRTNKTGGILPIHPCEKCSKMAQKFSISIRTVM